VIEKSDIGAIVFALAATLGLGWGAVFLARKLWPILPGWLAMILCIVLAVIAIGYPIYSLAKWSDRYLKRNR
jgi:fatty acid desaturase